MKLLALGLDQQLCPALDLHRRSSALLAGGEYQRVLQTGGGE